MPRSPVGYVRDRYHQGQKYVLQWLADASGASAATGHNTGQLEIKAADIDELGDRLLHTTKKSRRPPKDIDLCTKLLEHVIAGRKEGASWYQDQHGPGKYSSISCPRCLKCFCALRQRAQRPIRAIDSRSHKETCLPSAVES